MPNAHRERCPACHRSNDHYPAGELTLSAKFLAAQAREIIRLAGNVEALERHEHPMQRITGLEQAADQIVITTTDLQLPRRIGHALVKAYKGDLDTHCAEGGHFVRMTWRRND